jgi:hypothetical protein
MTREEQTRNIAPWSRVAILVATLGAGCALSYVFTGTVVPTTPADALIFQSTLLFVVLGSAILEHKFTRPADSVVNALMGIISLVTVYGVAPCKSMVGTVRLLPRRVRSSPYLHRRQY